MAAVLWVLAVAAAGLIYAGATGQSPKDELIAGLTGKPSPPPRPLDGAPAGEAVPAGGFAPDGYSAVSPYQPPTPSDPSQLVSLGQGGHRLRADAAASFARVERRVGRPVRLVGSYRSRAEQCATRAKNGCKDCTTSGAAAGCKVPTAPGGKSLHERGIAVDVHRDDIAASIAAFTAEGWHRWSPGVEPWHWSYREVG